MTYDGRAIANYVLDRCDAEGRSVTNLALQKIVFFCHVWCLIQLGRPLVAQAFEAWQFGPVLQYLYREFKAFDRSPIRARAKSLDPRTGRMSVASADFDESTRLLLDRTVSFYSRLSAGQLVEMSHVADGPWHKVWNHGGSVNPGMRIANDDIESFYSEVRRPFAIQ